jgi:hypothetical protein
MKIIYVCTLEGNNVFHNQSFEGCITHLSDLILIREEIKKKYNIEFEKLSAKWINGYYWQYDNITDDRDIKLIVYKTELIERD